MKDAPEVFNWIPQDVLADRVPLPKDTMVANMAVSRGDGALITKSVKSAWVLSLKPGNVGIAAYADEACEYKELLVLYVALADTVTSPNITKLQELFHRSVPYPIFLWMECKGEYYISGVPVRFSRAEHGKYVFDGAMVKTPRLMPGGAFPDVLRPAYTPTPNLRGLYYRWLGALYGVLIENVAWDKVLGHPLPFKPLNYEAAVEVWASIGSLYAEWNEVESKLKKERNPGKRVALGNRRHELQEALKAIAEHI